jgi:predicted  nucleic acid-binding Zn-ribbon protein
MDYRKALQHAAAADHAREQAELYRDAVSRVEEKLERLKAAVAATEEALAEARQAADDAEQEALAAEGRAASGVQQLALFDEQGENVGQNATVTAQSAGAAGGAHQEG